MSWHTAINDGTKLRQVWHNTRKIHGIFSCPIHYY